jgi:hypothetical protein
MGWPSAATHPKRLAIHAANVPTLAMPVKYVAEIKNVREICLIGSADLEFWKVHLGQMRLSPTNFAGHARIYISAMKLKWMGIAFEELSIAIPIDPPASNTPSVYLVSTFSTSRLLAWCERTFFQTPYEHAQITMQADQPWSFHLRDDTLSTLAVHCRSTLPISTVEDDWTVSIFLPSASQSSHRKFFHAKLTGPVQLAPFTATSAQFELQPSLQQLAIQLLVDSHFTPTEWRVRPSATHARSKTFTEG